MNCKHCNFVIDDESYDVCPNCGKPFKDEPIVEENTSIELPIKKDETELSADDQFTANFIKKDDPLANIEKVKKETKKASTAMMISRLAAVVAIIFFIGVLYYTKVVLPKLRQELSEIDQALRDGDSQQSTTTKSGNSISSVVLEAEFNDETILSLLKKAGIEYNKDITDVDITVKYPQGVNGQDFSIILNRTYSGGTYNDNVSFKIGDMSVSGIVRSYNKYNEDLITNIINYYNISNINNVIVMYAKSSTFQLSFTSTILVVNGSKFEKIEKVITTYSTDGISIVQCPITADVNKISYCSLTGDFEKGKETSINRVNRTYDNNETVIETVTALVSK